MVRDVASSDSFLSAHDPRLHFGLGAAEKVDRLTVHWTDGTTTTRSDVAVNETLRISKDAD